MVASPSRLPQIMLRSGISSHAHLEISQRHRFPQPSRTHPCTFFSRQLHIPPPEQRNPKPATLRRSKIVSIWQETVSKVVFPHRGKPHPLNKNSVTELDWVRLDALPANSKPFFSTLSRNSTTSLQQALFFTTSRFGCNRNKKTHITCALNNTSTIFSAQKGRKTLDQSCDRQRHLHQSGDWKHNLTRA